MTTTNNYNFAIGAAQVGVPLTAAMQTSLDTAMQGGAGTHTFIQNQIVINNFYAYLAEMGPAAWTASSDDNGNPVLFAAQESAPISIALVLAATFDQGVIDGGQPSSFTVNGESYWR